MINFWEKLKCLVNKHEVCSENKVIINNILKEISENSNYLTVQLRTSYLKNLLIDYDNNNTVLKILFKKIITECLNYVNQHKIDFHQLENQFRQNNINIYIIAKKFLKDNNETFCKLHNENKNFEAYFIISKNYEFYLSELTKCEYANSDENYENLKDCGILLISRSNIHDSNRDYYFI